MFYEQDTQPLPIIPQFHSTGETSQAYYQRLKALSDTTGVRFLFVYLADQKLKHSKVRSQSLPYTQKGQDRKESTRWQTR